MGVCVGDVNNDGWVDLVVTEYGAVRLFQNTGQGTFRELGPEAGLDNPRWRCQPAFWIRPRWMARPCGRATTWITTNPRVLRRPWAAGFLCAQSVRKHRHPPLAQRHRRPGRPSRFEDKTESAGLTRVLGAALAVICVDFNGDGWVDMFCADDARPNRLFINQRNGTFIEEGFSRGVAFNAMGFTAASMGTTLADVDGDGLWDMFCAHLAEEFHGFWKQGPRGVFIDQIASSGLQQQAWRGTGFGACSPISIRMAILIWLSATAWSAALYPGKHPFQPMSVRGGSLCSTGPAFPERRHRAVPGPIPLTIRPVRPSPGRTQPGAR